MNCGTEQGWRAHRSANEPACQYCKSWKTKHDAGTIVEAPIRSKRQVAQCGTLSGYSKHRRDGEPACRPCREAANEYQRTRSQKNRGEKPQRSNRHTANLQPCGTMAAYQRHKRDGEEPCQPCREAKRIASKEYQRKARALNQVKPRELKPHGTLAAANRHTKKHEPLCDPCREVVREKAKQRRAEATANRASREPRQYEHGTYAGAANHRRRGETPCDPCLQARRKYGQDAYEARKVTQ